MAESGDEMGVSGAGVSNYSNSANALARGVSAGPGVSGGGIAIIQPSLVLPFAQTKSLGGLITYTRASANAAYYNDSGILSYAPLNVPRFTHDPSTLQSLGLLIEEARTNLLTYSEEFDNGAWVKSGGVSVSANAVSAPDGTTTGDTISGATGTTGNPSGVPSDILYRAVTPSASTTYTASLWVKSAPSSSATTARLTIWNAYTGALSHVVFTPTATWTRVEVSLTTGASVSTIQYRLGNADGSLCIWGAQLEAGSFPTSYIKTTSSTATRAADNASITGTDFSSWYNQTEGAFVVDYENGLAGYIVLAAGSDTSNIIRLGTRLTGSSDEVLVVIDGGAGQVSLGNSPSTQRNICAAAYKQNDFALSMNGAAASTTSFGTVPTADTLAIGGTPFYGAFNGTIASIAYYPTRLSNSYLQYLTS